MPIPYIPQSCKASEPLTDGVSYTGWYIRSGEYLLIESVYRGKVYMQESEANGFRTIEDAAKSMPDDAVRAYHFIRDERPCDITDDLADEWCRHNLEDHLLNGSAIPDWVIQSFNFDDICRETVRELSDPTVADENCMSKTQIGVA